MYQRLPTIHLLDVHTVALSDVCLRTHCRLFCWHDFFFQAEDGIRDLVRSRGLGDVYKRQLDDQRDAAFFGIWQTGFYRFGGQSDAFFHTQLRTCLLYTSDAADERSSVDLGGRRILNKKTNKKKKKKQELPQLRSWTSLMTYISAKSLSTYRPATLRILMHNHKWR